LASYGSLAHKYLIIFSSAGRQTCPVGNDAAHTWGLTNSGTVHWLDEIAGWLPSFLVKIRGRATPGANSSWPPVAFYLPHHHRHHHLHLLPPFHRTTHYISTSSRYFLNLKTQPVPCSCRYLTKSNRKNGPPRGRPQRRSNQEE